MSLERICADLRARSLEQYAKQQQRENDALSPRIRRLIENNAIHQFGPGLEGAAQLFASFVEARTYKRLAAESIFNLRMLASHPRCTRTGWEKWFSKAQDCRRRAQELAHG